MTDFSRKIQTLLVNNSRIPGIEDTKFSGYYFYINTKIYSNFRIGISVPLKAFLVGFDLNVHSLKQGSLA